MGRVADEIVEADFDGLAEAYARYFGHDPYGSWILIVREDNNSEIVRFADTSDMWCCRSDRDRYFQRGPATSVALPFDLSAVHEHPVPGVPPDVVGPDPVTPREARTDQEGWRPPAVR